MKILLNFFLLLFFLNINLPAAESPLTLFLAPEKDTSSRKKIENWSYDFGDIEAGKIYQQRFILKNNSSQEIKIDEVFTSCGCTQAEVKSRIIPPLGEAELNITYSTEYALEGEDIKDVYIITGVPQQEFILTIKANIISSANRNKLP